jgi:cytohesin
MLCAAATTDFPSAPMMADFLIGAGADGNAENAQGATPLVLAAMNNKPEMAKLLLMKGVSSRASDKAGNTALHIAVERRYHTVSRILLEDQNAPLDAVNCRGRRPLSTLIVFGQQALREMLHAWTSESKESAAAAPRTPRQTPIAAAPSTLSTSQLQLQPPHGLARRATERILHWLAEQHCFGLVSAVVDSGVADLNAKDRSGDTLLHKAAREGSVAALRYLAGHGAQLDVPDRQGNTALHIAVLGREVEPVAELLHAGANANAVNARKNTPLHLLPLFIDEGQLTESRLSLALRGELQQPEGVEGGGTDSLLAHRRSRSDTTLAEKAEPSTSSTGTTAALPIRRASAGCRDDHVQIAQLLVRSGANTSATNSTRDTPFHIAARSRCASLLRIMLPDGQGHIDAMLSTNSDSATPLHGAMAASSSSCSCGSSLSKVVSLLLDAGSDVNAQDRHGDTVLHIAISHAAGEQIVRVLLDHGASKELANEVGETPLMIAHRSRNITVCRMLEAEECHV